MIRSERYNGSDDGAIIGQFVEQRLEVERGENDETEIENEIHGQFVCSDTKTSNTSWSASTNNNAIKSELDPYLFGLSFVVLSAFGITIAVLFDGFLPRIEPTVGTYNDRGRVVTHIENDNLHGGGGDVKLTSTADTFVAYRAFDDLKKLSGIGPKVIGTYENEILAVEFLTRQIQHIIDGNRNSYVKIDYDKQIVSGCFAVDIKRVGRNLCYENIQNIVVKVQTNETARAAAPSTEENILINCHFDSVYTSPGASDDGLHCAVMLEILRVLTSADKRLEKNVLFLFNGAEEDGLLASHGFVTRHKWASNITCFINLEACGAGGREILFQTGPMAYILPKIYSSSVPYPHGNVIGEELFQSGMLPSDTDFRIFRDFGKLKGLDFAHYKNGYVYHTENDDIDKISANVIHHTGSNIYALLNALILENNLGEKIAFNNYRAVYFDIFGRYMICYSSVTSVFINLSAIVLSIYSIFRVINDLYRRVPNLTAKNVAFCCFTNLSRLIIGMLVAYYLLSFLSVLLRWRKLTMLWYSNEWFVATYYAIPAILCIVFCSTFGRKFDKTFNDEQVTELSVVVIQAIITLLVFGGTLFYTRITYLLVIFLVPLSVSTLLRRTWMKNKSVEKNVATHIVCNSIPSLYVVYVSIQMFSLLIPIMGRCGSHKDSEKFIRSLCLLVTCGVFLVYIPLLNLVAHLWKLITPFTLCYALYVVVVLFVSSNSPFTGETPQRISIMHVHRKYMTSDNSIMENSGYLLTPMDARTPITVDLLLKDVRDLKRVEQICHAQLYCALPAMFPYLMNFVKSSYWIDAPKPMLPHTNTSTSTTTTTSKKPLLELVDVLTSGHYKIYNISIEGPSLVDFVILPLNGTRLVEWSLYDDPIDANPSSSWLNNKTYLIRRSRGLKIDNKWSFWLKFDISNATKRDVFKLSYSAHYRENNTNHYTNEFRHILSKFPSSWTRIVSWVVNYEEYSFE